MNQSTGTTLDPNADKNRWLSHSLLVLSLLATLAAVKILMSQLDLAQSADTWLALSGWTVLGLIVLLVCSSLARAARLYCHFHPEMKGRFAVCLRVSLQHNFFNNLMPLRTGEAAFPLLLKRHFNIEISRSAGALFAFRLADLGILLLIGTLALNIELNRSVESSHLPTILPIAIAGGILFPVLLYLLVRRLPWVAAQWSLFVSGISLSPGALFRLGLWSLAVWSIKLLSYGALLQAFTQTGYPLSLLAALSGELASGIPLLTPAAIGLFEAGVLAVLIPAGVSTPSAVTAAFNLHLFLFATSFLTAMLGFLIGRDSNVAR
jgi:uncharacterized membrane protein YbhN (UPF0104 family)